MAKNIIADKNMFPETEKHGFAKQKARNVAKKGKKILKFTGVVLGIASVAVITFYTLNKFLSVDSTKIEAPGSDALDQKIEQVSEEGVPSDQAVKDSFYEDEKPEEIPQDVQEQIKNDVHANVDTDDDSVEEKNSDKDEITK